MYLNVKYFPGYTALGKMFGNFLTKGKKWTEKARFQIDTNSQPLALFSKAEPLPTSASFFATGPISAFIDTVNILFGIVELRLDRHVLL